MVPALAYISRVVIIPVEYLGHMRIVCPCASFRPVKSYGQNGYCHDACQMQVWLLFLS